MPRVLSKSTSMNDRVFSKLQMIYWGFRFELLVLKLMKASRRPKGENTDPSALPVARG
jgi:hypothetical protein